LFNTLFSNDSLSLEPCIRIQIEEYKKKKQTTSISGALYPQSQETTIFIRKTKPEDINELLPRHIFFSANQKQYFFFRVL
jgi:hypothetical protein